jgi:two-component system osmolarity sensor histidine kinase EnvZ
MIRAITTQVEATSPAPLETAPAPLEMRPPPGALPVLAHLFLLSLLLIGSIVPGCRPSGSSSSSPGGADGAADRSLVNLSRAALVHADPIARVSLIKTLADQEGVRILPREPKDKYAALTGSAMDRRIVDELVGRLGSGTVMASTSTATRACGSASRSTATTTGCCSTGTSFRRSAADLAGLAHHGRRLSLAGAAVIARLINRPLKQLSFAASRVRDGDFDASRLDEKAVTSEIREVNIGFNRHGAAAGQDRAGPRRHAGRHLARPAHAAGAAAAWKPR